jgi:hypothetical protein
MPKIENKFKGFKWTLQDTLASPLTNLTRYIHEAEDNFPLSPHFFWVAGMPTKEQLLVRQRTMTMGSQQITVYPDTLAEDCSPTGSGLTRCPAGTNESQGGISKGTWPKLKADATHIANVDKLATELAQFKDTKLFYDVLHHWIGTPQGAGMRGFVALHEWYLNFTDWIEWLPEVNNDLGGGLFLDKRREMSQGMLNDVHNGTRRPKTPEKFCEVLRYFLKTTDTDKVGPYNNGTFATKPELGSEKTCYPKDGDIKFSRINAEMKCKMDLNEVCELANSTQEVEVMDGIRSEINGLDSKLKPIPYSFTWLFTEQYSVVRNEAYSNIALATVAVFIITIFFLNHIFCALLVTLNVLMVLVDVVALMYLWKLSINSVSIINLVLAIGLAVDYSAHVAHAFMGATGSRNERAEKAMREMGSDVIHGAFSTFLAVCVLSTSKSYIFRAMFQQFFGICVFGALHGLLLLPVVLSLVGPPTNKKGEDWETGKTGEEQHEPTSLQEVDIEQDPGTVPKSVNKMDAVKQEPQVVGIPNLDVGNVSGV